MAAASRSASRWVRAKATVPLIGGSLAYMHDPLTLMRLLYDRHGPVAPLAMPGRTTAFVLGPEDGLRLLARQGVEGLIVTPDLARHATGGFGRV